MHRDVGLSRCWLMTIRLRPCLKVDKAVGIDAGITSLIATSDGEKIANPKHFKRLRYKLRQAQKALSRKVKGSNNREKGKA
jgi:putative transposase